MGSSTLLRPFLKAPPGYVPCVYVDASLKPIASERHTRFVPTIMQRTQRVAVQVEETVDGAQAVLESYLLTDENGNGLGLVQTFHWHQLLAFLARGSVFATPKLCSRIAGLLGLIEVVPRVASKKRDGAITFYELRIRASEERVEVQNLGRLVRRELQSTALFSE